MAAQARFCMPELPSLHYNFSLSSPGNTREDEFPDIAGLQNLEDLGGFKKPQSQDLTSIFQEV